MAGGIADQLRLTLKIPPMFATCLHCLRSLGANEEIESFPVGDTLAFDSAKGRLWVICPKCSRWNLSPLDERWEAVEACEKAFRETTVRVSTNEIGLAPLRSGLTLVRVGKPLRPEFAAWRYGRQLLRRHRSALLTRAVNRVDNPEIPPEALLVPAVLLSAPIALFLGVPLAIGARVLQAWKYERPVCGVVVNGHRRSLKHAYLAEARFTGNATSGYRLQLPHATGIDDLEGENAVRLLGKVLAHLNNVGGNEKQIKTAVDKIEYFRSPSRLMDFVAARGDASRLPVAEALGYEQRLAGEMVVHEESERRAMEGELDAFHAEWRQAEEIAAIADNLLTPSGLLDRLRGTQSTEAE